MSDRQLAFVLLFAIYLVGAIVWEVRCYLARRRRGVQVARGRNLDRLAKDRYAFRRLPGEADDAYRDRIMDNLKNPRNR